MSCQSRQLAGSGLLFLTLAALPACHRVGGGSFLDPFAADLEAGALFFDSNVDGTLGAGDQLVVFLPNLPQGITAEEVLADIQLPVLRDSLGQNPTAELSGGRLVITLGEGARLKSRQIFDSQNIIENSASGVEYTGATPLSADIVPGFVGTGLGFEGAINSLAAIDYNQDGFPDLVHADDLELTVQQGSNDGLFSLIAFPIPATGETRGLRVADFDRDGRDDVLHLSATGVRLWLRTDTGLEPAADGAVYGSDARDADILDYNQDGTLDVLVADGLGTLALFGDGAGGFTEESLSVNELVSAVVAGDFDSDGDVDIVRAISSGGQDSLVYVERTGADLAAPVELLAATSVSALRAADFDHDGTLDLAVGLGGEDGALRVLYGDNVAGQFLQRQHQSAILLTTEELGLGPALKLDVADVDSDGREDILLATATGVRVYQNTGPFFRECPGEVRAVTSDVTRADFDLDGDLDLITGGSQGATLHRGSLSATWGFVRLQDGQDLGNLRTHSLAAGDVDNDGTLELWTGNNEILERWVRATPTADYELVESIELPLTRVQDLELFDIDRDGDLDVLAAFEQFGAEANGLWIGLQAADGSFAEFPQTFTNLNPTSSLSLGDFDQDGDMDLAVGGMNIQPDQALINLGYDGDTWLGFSPSITLLPPAIHSSDVRWVDADRDGDLDLITAHIPGEPNRLWIQEDGNFTETVLPDSVELNCRSIALGDLNLDGQLDLVTGNAIGERIWLREGNSYVLFQQDLANSDTYELTLARVDGDAYLDLIIANRGIASQEGVQVWLNRGVFFNDDNKGLAGKGGGFGLWLGFGQNDGRPDYVLKRGAVGSVLAGDFDRDGDIDIVSGSVSPDAANAVWLNR